LVIEKSGGVAEGHEVGFFNIPTSSPIGGFAPSETLFASYFWVGTAYPKVGLGRSPKYKRNPTSWPSATPPDFSIFTYTVKRCKWLRVKYNNFLFRNYQRNPRRSMSAKINNDPQSKTLFINKYRPHTIDEFCADDKLKLVLKTLLAIEDLNILLIGETCSGKTTILNAIIREYYQMDGGKVTATQPSGDFSLENNNNILYINSLKEQGIGFYRNEMKTFSQSHSTIYGKKKMIIIDDIDTINEQSQHVFRNYIDKYKHNVHFLSVCTNIQKVIESLQSRVHIIRIESTTKEQVRTLMYRIMKEERLYLSAECQEFILKYSNRSIRTMVNYLEKIHIYLGDEYPVNTGIVNGTDLVQDVQTQSNDEERGRSMTVKTCMDVCADIKIHVFDKYIELLKEHRLVDAIYIMHSIHDYGFSVIDILELFFVFVKETASLKEEDKYEIVKLLCKYITVFYSVHEDVIELSLFTYAVCKVIS